jgi:myo-inositol 2-dehydrogenase/D-chiro-inositol 1-dehydrogenase
VISSSTHAFAARRSSRAPERLRDPLVLLLESEGGVLVDVELSVSVGYGYDVRCEVVGESGTASLGDEGAVRLVAAGKRSTRVPSDWRDRFADAYEAELRAWLEATAVGGCTGPSAWDGYAAAVVAQTAWPRHGPEKRRRWY